MILKNHEVKNTKNVLLGHGTAKEVKGSKILSSRQSRLCKEVNL